VCDDLGRNQVCYGNALVEVELRENAQAAFTRAGDMIDLDGVTSISTAALDERVGQWGIAILKAQAALDDTLPGQNITFLLFGDTRLENPTADMQAVRLTTGVGSVTCEGTPPPALLIQSPTGQQVTMNINGADVTFGSTLIFTAAPNAEMTVGTLEGQGEVTAFGTTEQIVPGAQVRLPLGGANGTDVIGPPSPPEPLVVDNGANLPLPALERPITLPSPIAPAVPITPTVTVTPAGVTPGASASVSLSADRTTVAAGECATITWQAADAQQVLFEGQPANTSGSRQVCPTGTRTYTLLVVNADNTRAPYTVTITVQ
jgi:hypothetical protein